MITDHDRALDAELNARRCDRIARAFRDDGLRRAAEHMDVIAADYAWIARYWRELESVATDCA